MSISLPLHGLQPSRLLCPWSSPGKNTGVGCHALLRGSSRPRDWIQVSRIAGGFFTIWATGKDPGSYKLRPTLNFSTSLLGAGPLKDVRHDVWHLLKAANTLLRDAMASESTSSHSISCLETAFRGERGRERSRLNPVGTQQEVMGGNNNTKFALLIHIYRASAHVLCGWGTISAKFRHLVGQGKPQHGADLKDWSWWAMIKRVPLPSLPAPRLVGRHMEAPILINVFISTRNYFHF